MSHIGDAIQPRFEPCRCDSCKYGSTPGADAVLYAGEDAVDLMILAAKRDGRYEDIDAFADAATARAHVELNATARKFSAALLPVWRRYEALMLAQPTVAMEAVR